MTSHIFYQPSLQATTESEYHAIRFQAHEGAFHAKLIIEMLPILPLFKIRKLFHLMLSSPDGNAEAIAITREWITKALFEAESGLTSARADYTKGYQPIPKDNHYSYYNQRQRNRKLTKALKTAEADYKKLQKIQLAYEKEK